jgi:hypothetical protein
MIRTYLLQLLPRLCVQSYGVQDYMLPIFRLGVPFSVPDQVMWWTEWHWDRFSSRISVSPASSRSTNFSVLFNHSMIDVM